MEAEKWHDPKSSERSERATREFALLFLDLDGLKQINDRFGHLVGSQALCRLADVLSICSRKVDTPARFGGDEFALVLPETEQVPGDSFPVGSNVDQQRGNRAASSRRWTNRQTGL